MKAKPSVLMIAGPNGSGKTTLTNELRRRGLDFGEYINPDDIARELDGSDIERARAAQQEADRRREACLAGKRSFSFETVMSHPSKIEVLRKARAAGFTTVALTLAADAVDLAAVAERQRAAPGKLAILLGTEGAGLSQRWSDGADIRAVIPMQAGIDSLNVAAASAVACYVLGR